MASGSLDCDLIADNSLVDVTLKVEARSKTFRQESTCWRMPSSQMPFGGLSMLLGAWTSAGCLRLPHCGKVWSPYQHCNACFAWSGVVRAKSALTASTCRRSGMLRLPWEDRHLVLNGVYDLCVTSREVLKPEAGTVLAALELKHLGWHKLVFTAKSIPLKSLVCLTHMKCFRQPIIGASRNKARSLPRPGMLLSCSCVCRVCMAFWF